MKDKTPNSENNLKGYDCVQCGYLAENADNYLGGLEKQIHFSLSCFTDYYAGYCPKCLEWSTFEKGE